MSAYNPQSRLDRLVGVCLTLLVCAATIYIAVRLIEAVWTALLVILGVTALVAIAIAVTRYRRDIW